MVSSSSSEAVGGGNFEVVLGLADPVAPLLDGEKAMGAFFLCCCHKIDRSLSAT